MTTDEAPFGPYVLSSLLSSLLSSSLLTPARCRYVNLGKDGRINSEMPIRRYNYDKLCKSQVLLLLLLVLLLRLLIVLVLPVLLLVTCCSCCSGY